ncbi:hypothetical protein DPMN_108152 [Dreissena polymorpha]|uniref:Uncharacterized protein n=1 Tax=Dreissena polymorpha TaxID=45954 RepID=A0A9D4K8B2_DREPO|nr:hypothetical protein DPMN_108152 [Dreissena polymorpha]
MDALEDREGTVSIDGRTVTHIYFTIDIESLAGSEKKLKEPSGTIGKHLHSLRHSD